MLLPSRLAHFSSSQADPCRDGELYSAPPVVLLWTSCPDEGLVACARLCLAAHQLYAGTLLIWPHRLLRLQFAHKVHGSLQHMQRRSETLTF